MTNNFNEIYKKITNDSTEPKKIIFLSQAGLLPAHYLYKDPGEVLYYFSKLYNYEAIADGFYNDVGKNGMFRTVNLMKYSSDKFWKLKTTFNIFKNAKKIDILYLLCIQPDSFFKAIAYRLGCGAGKIYMKTDLGLYEKNGKDLLILKNMPLYLKIAHTIFKPLPDIYTVETHNAYARLENTFYGDLIEKNKLFYMPNGIDPELLNELNIERLPVQEKEKIILTVARIGTYQKNSELLLEILENTDLKDWKMYIVGAIEPLFLDKIKLFYHNNPNKQNCVIFTDMLSQKEKFELYNKARIFIFTSHHESYAFTLAEAAYMRNYIITTNVGIADELKELSPCFISNNHSKAEMQKELQRIINLTPEELNNIVPNHNLKEITWESVMRGCDGMRKLTTQ